MEREITFYKILGKNKKYAKKSKKERKMSTKLREGKVKWLFFFFILPQKSLLLTEKGKHLKWHTIPSSLT